MTGDSSNAGKGAVEAAPGAQATLEQALSRLDEIINRMEDGNLPLEQLLQDYEEGAKLVRLCQERLTAAEKRILVVTKSLDGTLGLADYEEGSDTQA